MEDPDYGQCLQIIKDRRDPVEVCGAMEVVLGAVKSIFTKWIDVNHHWADAEDAKQWASMAILEAAEIYDPKKGVAIRLVSRCVSRRLRHEYKYFAATMGRESRELLGYEKRQAELISDPVDGLIEVDNRDEARKWFPILMNNLGEKERAVFGRYVEGSSLRDIANELGIDRGLVYDAIYRAFEKFANLRRVAEAA
jgi:RNA polymerase sigma factor (sigma-70 family)